MLLQVEPQNRNGELSTIGLVPPLYVPFPASGFQNQDTREIGEPLCKVALLVFSHFYEEEKNYADYLSRHRIAHVRAAGVNL